MNDKSVLDIIERGLRGNTIDDLIDGWSFSIDEVSSNVYKVEGIDVQGHHVHGYGVDPEEVLTNCMKDAQRVVQRKNFLTKTKTDIARLLKLKKITANHYGDREFLAFEFHCFRARS